MSQSPDFTLFTHMYILTPIYPLPKHTNTHIHIPIYIGMIDVKNLSELLSQSPDVVDDVGAVAIPVVGYRYVELCVDVYIYVQYIYIYSRI